MARIPGAVHAPTNGMPGRLLGATIDTTLRKHAEEAFRASEARLAVGADLAGLGYYEVDLSESSCFVDDRFHDICSLPAGEQQGLEALEFWMEHLHPDDRDRVLEERRHHEEDGCRIRGRSCSGRRAPPYRGKQPTLINSSEPMYPMNLPLNKTKIVATIGPASNTPEILEAMIRAGLNVARINLSHGDFSTHGRNIETIRAASTAVGRPELSGRYRDSGPRGQTRHHPGQGGGARNW